MYTSMYTDIKYSSFTYSQWRKGFTLIELLMVVSIMVMLYSMLSVLMSAAQRQGKATNTRATLMKVDQAVRLFRNDMRIYPWQTDLGVAPAEPLAWGNNLAWRLAWSPPPVVEATAIDPDRTTYIKRFQADISTISSRFRFVNGRNVPPSGNASEGTHAFRNESPTNSSRTNLLIAAGSGQETVAKIISYAGRWLPGTPSYGNDCTGDAQALTKMAEEVTILAYTAGQMPTLAPTGIDATQAADKARFPSEDERYPSFTLGSPSTTSFRYIPYNKVGFYGDDSRGPLLTSVTATAQGWRGDYLAAAINVSGSTGGRLDVDASGEAIVDAWGHPLIYVCSVRPGVRGYMSALTTSIFSGAREERYNMGPQGRTATTSLASDIRTTAAAAYVYEFELWSAGPDGKFAAARDDLVNRDNLALLSYTKELQ